MRKDLLVTDEIYHIFTRSIANFQIFNKDIEFQRMLQLLKYYQTNNDVRFSYFLNHKITQNLDFNKALDIVADGKEKLVQIVAYCLMPTHIHLIIKQLSDKGIAIFMSNILNSYTRYFNIIHKRKGPLWECRFQNVLVISDEQLLHLTRYIHLNPVTAFLVAKPELWKYSSLNEYLLEKSNMVCRFDGLLEIQPLSYRRFINSRITYQRQLAKIKNAIID